MSGCKLEATSSTITGGISCNNDMVDEKCKINMKMLYPRFHKNNLK